MSRPDDAPPKTSLYSHHWERRVFDDVICKAELKPNKLHIQLTRRCNHRCITCNHHLVKQGKDVLSTELMQKLLDEASSFGMDNLSLTGGEPLLREDLLDIVSAARNRGFETVTVATNGDLLTNEDRARALLDAGATHIPISLHGIETHDEIVGARGSSKRVMRAVETLLDLTGGDGDRISVGMVVMDRTLDQLDPLAEYCRSVGCGLRINVLDSTLFFFDEGTKTSELRPRENDAIDRFIDRCFELSAEGLLRLWPRNLIFVEHYLKNRPIEAPCPVGLEALYVAYDGSYRPGCWVKETGLTVHQHSPEEAWAHPRFRDELHDAFRRRCPGCGCTFRTMSAWYVPYIVEGWRRTGRFEL